MGWVKNDNDSDSDNDNDSFDKTFKSFFLINSLLANFLNNRLIFQFTKIICF